LIELQCVDNNLVVHEKISWFGIVLLIPGWEHQTIWARFPAK
jgi:hypothetical protein